MIGANARDIDVGASFGPDFYSLAHRRGWTHGLLAIAVLPFLDARYLGTDRLGAPVVIVDRDLEARYVD